MTAHTPDGFAVPSAAVYIRPAVLTIDEATDYIKVGRTKLFALIKEGRFDVRRNGTRNVITVASLDAYLAALPSVGKAEQ